MITLSTVLPASLTTLSPISSRELVAASHISQSRESRQGLLAVSRLELHAHQLQLRSQAGVVCGPDYSSRLSEVLVK